MNAKSVIIRGILFSAALLVFPARAHPITIHDFLVNPPGLEAIPHMIPEIAFDQEGGFVILWVDRGLEHENRQVYFQRFNPSGIHLGDPVSVSDTTCPYHGGADIAMGPAGNFIICWSKWQKIGEFFYYYDIWAEGFDSSGQSAWPRQQVDVDRAAPELVDYHPRVAMDDEGRSVVVWQTQDSGGRNVYAQQFDASGARVGNNFLVSDVNASNYDLCEWFTQFPDVAFNSEGYFLICWHSCILCDPTADAPLARVYNPDGGPVTLIFPIVNPCSSYWDYGNDATVASNGQNNFVVAFSGNDTLWTYPNNAVMVQAFDTLGAPVDSVKILNDVVDLGDIFFKPRIAVDDSDGCVVIWCDWRQITAQNLWAQRLNSSGELLGQNYRINLPPGSLSTPGYENRFDYSLAIHENTAGFAWLDYRNWPTYNTDIYAKLLDLDIIGFYLPGDVVLDGIVNLTDVIYLLNYLFRAGPGPLPEWTGDVTSDGEVDISDVIYLLNYLFRSGPPPRP